MSDHLLFSYGTLRLPDVQMALFGRLIQGEEDAMVGWSQRIIEITDPDVIAKSGTRWHPLVEPSEHPEDAVAGLVFAITEADLASADAYEVDYRRRAVALRSGRQAWFYGTPEAD
jgi:gamma-glutamylcyclotransferase (GGCT)/AIG2-like uncharacterized protein YtfP